MRFLRAMGVGLLWFLPAPPILAADSWPGVPMPSMESDVAGSIIPEDCSVNLVSGEAIVNLVVRTGADNPRLELNGPLFGSQDPSEPYPDRHFPELTFRVNGNPREPIDHFDAFVGATNITNLVRAAKMDPWAIARSPPLTSAQPVNAQILKALKNLHAIEDVPDGMPSDDNAYVAKWVARRRLEIALDAGREQRIELRYQARPAVAPSRPEDLVTNAREKTYCVSSKQVKRLFAGSPSLRVEEYSLPTGIDGRAPRSVTFAMSSGKTTTQPLIFLCGPQGKPVVAVGSMPAKPAEVDDTGVVHVMTVAR